MWWQGGGEGGVWRGPAGEGALRAGAAPRPRRAHARSTIEEDVRDASPRPTGRRDARRAMPHRAERRTRRGRRGDRLPRVVIFRGPHTTERTHPARRRHIRQKTKHLTYTRHAGHARGDPRTPALGLVIQILRLVRRTHALPFGSALLCASPRRPVALSTRNLGGGGCFRAAGPDPTRPRPPARELGAIARPFPSNPAPRPAPESRGRGLR